MGTLPPKRRSTLRCSDTGVYITPLPAPLMPVTISRHAHVLGLGRAP
jgi:hypothetical protein